MISPEDLQSMVDALNTAFAADPDAIHALLCSRVPCNDRLVSHPTCVCGVNLALTPRHNPALSSPPKAHYTVGPLGLINAMVGAAAGKRIAMVLDIDEEDGQGRMVGFKVVEIEEAQIVKAEWSGSEWSIFRKAGDPNQERFNFVDEASKATTETTAPVEADRPVESGGS